MRISQTLVHSAGRRRASFDSRRGFTLRIVLAIAWVMAAGSAQAVSIDFTTMGTFTIDELGLGVPVVTGSANVNVSKTFGLGIVGGASNTEVDFGEFITFSFLQPAADIGLSFITLGGNDTANVNIEAFKPGGASLGTELVDLFPVAAGWDVSAVFGDVAIEKFTLTPLDTNFQGTHTDFSIHKLEFVVVPEPSACALILLGILGVLRRRLGARGSW